MCEPLTVRNNPMMTASGLPTLCLAVGTASLSGDRNVSKRLRRNGCAVVGDGMVRRSNELNRENCPAKDSVDNFQPISNECGSLTTKILARRAT